MLVKGGKDSSSVLNPGWEKFSTSWDSRCFHNPILPFTQAGVASHMPACPKPALDASLQPMQSC